MNSISQIAGLIAWVISVITVSFFIWHQDTFFHQSSDPIANINIAKATASVRSEGLIRWRDAVQNQSLFDGDWIYAPPASQSKIKLGSGQVIELGEDTLVQIRAIMRENLEYSYLLSLVKGSVTADLKSECKKCPAITIKSEEKSFNVSAGETLTFKKEVGRNIKKLASKALPTFDGKRTALMGVLDQTFSSSLEKQVIVLPSTEPPPVEEKPNIIKKPPEEKPKVEPIKTPNLDLSITQNDLKIKSLIATIETDGTNKLSFTTDYKVADLKSAKIIIKMQIPKIQDILRKVVPALQLSNGTKKEFIQGIPGTSEVTIPIEKIIALGGLTHTGFIRDYNAKILPGILLEGNKPVQEDFKGIEVEISIRFLGEVISPYVLLYLEMEKQDSNFSNPWISPKRIVKNGAEVPGLMISLADYRKLRSLIRGAKGIGIYPATSSNEGIFLVRNKGFVGEIVNLTNTNLDSIRGVLNLLKVDLAFKGKRMSYYEQAAGSDLQVSVNKFLDDGKTVYVLKRGKVYPISRQFVKSNQEVAAFIDTQAKAVFFDKVDIIHSM